MRYFERDCLRLQGKFDKTGTPAKTRGTPGKPNPYAEFTKQHMAEISASLPSGTAHKEVMVEVGRRWRAHKERLASGGARRQASPLSGFGLEDGDEAFARQLQRQLDAEAAPRPVGLIVD